MLNACGDDALVIAAHVNGPHGLLGLEGRQRAAVLRNPRLAAVELHPGRHIDESWLDGSKPEVGRRLSQVWASNGHAFHELGQRFTWAKMTRPNLEGLRLALLDGAASIRPAVQGAPGDPNAHAALAIERITVSKGRFIGRSEPTTVTFNPWLNAVIGGRGTGKSTLVDFCRKTLRRDAELDGSGSAEEGSLRSLFDRRMRLPSLRREGLLTRETRIEIVYRRDGVRYALSWSLDGTALPIARLAEGARLPEEGNIGERFPVRIYSQKQLFALAQDPNALLAVIDADQAVRGAEVYRRLQEAATRYLSLCAQARMEAERASRLPARTALLTDIRHKLDVLQKVEHAQLLTAYRMRRLHDDTWQAILALALEEVDAVQRSAEELVISDLDIGAETDGADPALESLGRMHESLRRAVAELRRGVCKRITRTHDNIARLTKGIDAHRWKEAIAFSRSRFAEASARLAEQGISDPSDYSDLLQQAGDAEREIKALKKALIRAKKLEGEAADALDDYRVLRREMYDRRRRFAEGTSSDVVRIEVDAYANHKNLANELGEILGIGRFEADRSAIAENIRPDNDRHWSWESLDRVVKTMRKFLSGELESWPTRDRRFENALRRVPPERIDRLALYLPEDAVNVKFRDASHGGAWRSLAQGSPGQQTAALLAFVLGHGSEPIILDQPEDDLDNTLIYELLVRRLRETKLARQVIVVTHNPNIVVHGDAEFVLSLEVRNRQTHIACQGGLQERRVRDEICRVMEGGHEAFESRYRRIMPPGEPVAEPPASTESGEAPARQGTSKDQ